MGRGRTKKRISEKSDRRSYSPWKIAFAVSGWLVAAFVGVLDLPNKVNLFFNEWPNAARNLDNWWNLDNDFTGVWTSNIEGWVDATDQQRKLAALEGGPVAIKIRVYNGKMEGEISSEGLRKNHIFSRLMMRGHKRRRIVEGVVYDYYAGKPLVLAQIQIEIFQEGGREILRLRTLRQQRKYLPEQADLYRDDAAMPDNLGELNLDFLNQMIQSRRKTKTE